MLLPHVSQEFNKQDVGRSLATHYILESHTSSSVQELTSPGLQVEKRNTSQTVRNLIENIDVAQIRKYENGLCVVEKNKEDGIGWDGQHPYYMERCQKKVLAKHKK